MDYKIVLHFYDGKEIWKSVCKSLSDIGPAVLEGQRKNGKIIRREVVKTYPGGGVSTTTIF